MDSLYATVVLNFLWCHRSFDLSSQRHFIHELLTVDEKDNFALRTHLSAPFSLFLFFLLRPLHRLPHR